MRAKIIGLALGMMVGLQGATQSFAWIYGWADALGKSWPVSAEARLYPPWSILVWRTAFAEEARGALNRSGVVILLGAVVGLSLGALADAPSTLPRRRGWGGLAEARRASLLAKSGAVLGVLHGRLLATEDLRPTLVTGGTRSGKGRGHVVPTLLSWGGSVLVHDPKGELWAVTAGWRSRFSHALYLAPRDEASARWNPLAEIQPGPGELAQVQRLVAILSDPGGTRDEEAIWDKAASEILEAVILHVLYTTEDQDKTLLKVRALLADLDEAADVMLKTLHRLGADGEPQVHPFIQTAVKGYAAMHDRFRTSVQGTARSYLKWLAGEDVERALSASDFAMGDLMCAEAPLSLYVQVAPADAAALRPLVRLLFYAAAQVLTAEEKRDAAGRIKRHKLLMVMDEFPLLGRLGFFEKSLRLMSGYGIKAMFVAQSLNDIVETYGPHNTILDNCHVFTAFSALDPLTQDKVSKLTGSVTETRTSRSAPSGFGAGRSSVSRSEVERPLLEPGEIRALPDDRQLVFVAGQRPLRTRKLLYDRREPFRSRAGAAPPDQALHVDTPGQPPHPWLGRRSLGRDALASLPLFKEVAGAMDDRKAASRAADIYGRVAQEMAAQQAVLDQLQGGSDGET
ncbi:MAG: type IV secretory system conjugative DNA transfer family protein [Brevundimonas sp.]|jgi:type IV secretion system protein VirD4|uniref:type IV secretory system conjugative DNA transfer family protein n=1 Tax=Brevundimonas sp. TaxID=1871086 RepID=UPI0025C6D2EC|nr:type IV secretory system conjugative DNA transfer family protein [Brevundimonas sp.]MCH4269653.1 type IV secretory system conjugative DNA transfer family protein [Brevundimonas sp.]